MPVTRSGAKPSVGAGAHLLDPKVDTTASEQLASSLDNLDDGATVQGRDAKLLRDAAALAIAQVWTDSRATTALLARRINDGNSALTEKLNESFSAGRRLDALPTVAMLQPVSQLPRISPFSGSADNGTQFSIWIRRLEDVMRMRPSALTSEQRANFLIGYLDGVAREKVEELSEDDRKDFDTVVAHLKAYFESPQQRYVARQKLSACRQEHGESCAVFANRVLNLGYLRCKRSDEAPAQQGSTAGPVDHNVPRPPGAQRSSERALLQRPVGQRNGPIRSPASPRRVQNSYPTIPLVVVDVQGTSSRSLTGSHSNPTKAQVCRDIVQCLLARHMPAASVGIITFYKEQYRLMEQYAAQQGVILHTVDSVQGKEMDVVILLTTRTGIDPARSEFLDDKLRMNVAIRRCRHGQFILGRLDDLEKLPNWGRLIRWASERGTVVSTATLPDLFE